MERQLINLFACQRGVATREQVLSCISERRLRTHVERQRLVRVRRAVYASGPLTGRTPTELAALHARAELLVRRRCEVVTGLTACVVHGLPFLGRLPEVPRLSLPREDGERPREDRPRSWLPDEQVTQVEDIPVTTLARTVVDVARTRPFAFAVVTADAALRSGCSRDDMQEVIRLCRNWPGARAARRVVSFADALSESPLESLGRARFHESGLPAPELQVDLGDDEQQVRVDHFWRAKRTVAEADGALKYTDPRVLVQEKIREDGLRDRGMEVVRYMWDDALRRPDRLNLRVRAAFLRGQRAA